MPSPSASNIFLPGRFSLSSCGIYHCRPDTVGGPRFTFSPSKTDIYNGRLKTQDPGLKIQKILLSPGSCVLCLNNSDYFHYSVWIAKPFNANVLQHFHQKKMITSITYSIENDYYIHYLSQKSKNLETEN